MLNLTEVDDGIFRAILAAHSYPRTGAGWDNETAINKINQQARARLGRPHQVTENLTEDEEQAVLAACNRDKNLVAILTEDCEVGDVQGFLDRQLKS